MEKKLNVGSGAKILPGYINLDICALDGVDIVHDLNVYPWPFEENSFDYILLEDIIEHLDSPVMAIEEVYRIAKANSKIDIQVPYWNSWSANTDITHKNYFTENSFDSFIPATKIGQARGYYSKAKFKVVYKSFVITPLLPWLPIPKLSFFEFKGGIAFFLLRVMASFFSNIIQDFKISLEPIKEGV